MNVQTKLVENHSVVTKEKWLKERKELLKKEKELTRFRDEINAQRLKLPMVKIEKSYIFDGPDWKNGCKSCSFLSDHIDGARVHLENHDVSIVAVSRAPLTILEKYRKRMGWHFKWLSSFENDFNHDFNVTFTEEEIASGNGIYNYQAKGFPADEAPGASAFYKDADGSVFHTYSSYARGLDILLGAYNWLDMAPKGRNESGLMDWVKHRDRYGKN